MKKYFTTFLIMQLVFASFMAISHGALAGSTTHEALHSHTGEREHHHADNFNHSAGLDSVCDVHVHLTFLENGIIDYQFIPSNSTLVRFSNVSFLNSSTKPLLPPPNS